MKHAGIYSTAAMLGKMVGFLMLPFYAHILRGNGYAVIGMLDAGLALLISLLAYGVNGANVRFYHDQKDPHKKKTVITTGVYLIIGVTTIMVLPVVLFSRPIAGYLLDNPDFNRFLIMALLSLIFEMAGQGASSWLLIRSQSVKFAAINLLRLVIGLSLNIWLIVVKGMGLDGYFISALIASVISNSIILYFTFRDCGNHFDRHIAKQISSFLLPLIPGNLASFVSQQAERYLIKFQIDLASVGILEMGYKFPVLIVQFVTTPFMQSWNTRRFEMADQPGASRHIGEMFTYYLFLVTLIGLVMAVVIKQILIILTPPEFHPAYRIAQVEIISMILSGVYYHITFGLFYAKHTRTLAMIRGWSSAVKVVLSFLFISSFGIAGAAWSSAIIAAASVVIGFHLAQRRFRIFMEWEKILLICVTALGVFFLLSNWAPSNTAIFRIIDGQWLPTLTERLASSPLGTWKDGKLSIILSERSAPITEVLIKGVLASLFVLIIPIIHNSTKQKLKRRLRVFGKLFN